MKNIIFFLKLSVSILICYVIFSKIDLEKTKAVYQSIDLRYFAAALGAAILGNVFAAGTTWQALKIVGIPMKFTRVLRINYISYYFSCLNVMAGGALRWHSFSKSDSKSENKTIEAASAILIERLESVWIFAVFFIPVFYAKNLSFSEMERQGFFIFEVLLVVVVALSLALIFFIPPVLPVKHINSILIDLRTRKKNILFSTILMIFSFLSGYIVFILAARSLGVLLGPEVLWVYALTGAAVMVPVTVLGLGVREGLLVHLLQKFGVQPETGLAIGFLIFFTVIAQALAGGLVYLMETLFNRSKCK